MVKTGTLFQTKTAKNHTLWRRKYLYSLYKRVPPGAKNALQIMSLAAQASENDNREKSFKECELNASLLKSDVLIAVAVVAPWTLRQWRVAAKKILSVTVLDPSVIVP